MKLDETARLLNEVGLQAPASEVAPHVLSAELDALATSAWDAAHAVVLQCAEAAEDKLFLSAANDAIRGRDGAHEGVETWAEFRERLGQVEEVFTLSLTLKGMSKLPAVDAVVGGERATAESETTKVCQAAAQQ